MKTTKKTSRETRRMIDRILELNVEVDELKEKCDSLEKEKQNYYDKWTRASEIINSMAQSIIKEGEEWKSGHTLTKSPASKVKTIDQMSNEEINQLIEEKRKKKLE